MKWINYIIANNKYRSLFYSVISVMIELFIINTFSSIGYLTSDDTHIQAALNGTWTGTEYPFHQFINVFLGYFICTLYSFFPYVQWWFVYNMFCMITGLIMLHFTIFYNLKNCKSALTVIIFLTAGFELYCLTRVSFLIVPVFFSLGAISLLLLNKPNTRLRWNSILIAFVSVVLIISYLQREESILLMFAFYILALAIYTLKVNNNALSLKIFGKFIVTISLTLVIMFILSNASADIKNDINGMEFQEYNTNRISYMDYPHPVYQDAVEIYQKYGWDETSFQLVHKWCFMLDEYNLESISGINRELDLHGLSISNLFKEGIVNNFNKIVDFFSTLAIDYFTFFKVCLICTLVAYFLYGIYAFIIKRTPLDIAYIQGLLSLCGGMFILIILIICGRTPQRVLISVTFPAVTIAILMFFQQNKIENMKFLHNFLLICGIIFLGACIKIGLPSHNDNDRYNDRYETLYTYCISHDQDIFIIDTSRSSFDILNSLGREFPSNILFWGDSTSYSDLYYKRLQRLGLNELTLSSLNEENVYFISLGPNSTSFHLLKDKIEKSYKNGNVELIKQLNEEQYIYKFSW